jgi:hypothetical protein
MKFFKLVALFILFFITTGAYAATWSGTELDLNTALAKSITSVDATINYSGSDLNAVCFNTSDNSATSHCFETEAVSPIIIPLTTALTGISTGGNYTVYAFLKQDDENYSSSSSESITIDGTGPTYTVFPASGGDYNYNDFTFDIHFSDTSTPVTSIIKLDGSTITNGASLVDLNEGTHTITIDANDSLGNQTIGTVTFRVDTTPPSNATITSSYTSTYTNDTQPDFTISGTDSGSGMTGGQAALSCNSAGPWYVTTYSTTINSFDITSEDYDCNSSDGNKTIYLKVRDKAGNWMADTNAKQRGILYDGTKPSAPTAVNSSPGNAKISLSWETPELDNKSGNDKILIYMKKTPGSYSLKTTLTDENDTAEDITGLTNGDEYCFKLTTMDRAGNESAYSDETCAAPASSIASIAIKKNGTTISGDVSFSKVGDVIKITCTYSASISGAQIKIKAYNPTSSDQDLATASASTTTLEKEYTIPVGTEYEKLGFWCTATAVNNSSIRYVLLDTESPTINWTDTNTSFTGLQTMIVTVSDNKLISKVELDLNSKIIAGTKVTDTKYKIDFNTPQYDNGTYLLKANVYDSAENKTTISRTISIENISSAKQKAEKMILVATEKQVTANTTITALTRQGLVVPKDLMDKKSQADTDLSQSKALITTDADTALLKATSASALYEEFNTTTKTQVTQTKNYVYDSNGLLAQLKALGFKEEQATQISTVLTNSTMNRKLELVRVGNGNTMQVKITITFTNDTNNTELKIVEIIPKELAASAQKIVSDTNFSVIQNDPIIQFNVNAPKGSQTVITYGIGEITTIEANKIIDNNIISKFSSPPLILGKDDKPEEVLGGLSFNTPTIILIAGIIIVILIIAAIIFFVRFTKPEHGFGEKKSLTDQITGGKKEKKEEKPKWSSP